MDPKEKLAALAAEAETLRAKAQGNDFTEEDAARAQQVAKEHKETADLIARKEAAGKALQGLGGPAQRSDDDAPARKTSNLTVGERFVQSDAMKNFRENTGGEVGRDTPIKVEAKGIGSKGARIGRKLLTSADSNPAPVREAGIEDLVYRPERRLLDVITQGTTDLSWVEYRQVISKTNNAAIVPEATSSAPIDGTTVTEAAGGLKPISSLQTQTADARAYTYADGMEVTNQELSDDGLIQSLIDSTLTENLEIELERILLNGTGVAGEPARILNTTRVLQQAFATDVPTTLRKAITLLRTTSGANIRGVLLNPEDDEAWDLLKDADGRYLGNGPFGTGPGTAWGYERIASQAIPVGQALIGDFSTIHLLQKEALSILAFNQHKDFAQRNLVYIRAELRAMQLIRNAARLAVVDLTAA